LQYKKLASAFYTLNSKYRISWECAKPLIDLASSGDGGASTMASWGVALAPPLEFPLPHPSKIWVGLVALIRGWGRRRAGKERSHLWGMKRNLHHRLRRSQLAFGVIEQYACCCFEYQQLVAHVNWLT